MDTKLMKPDDRRRATFEFKPIDHLVRSELCFLDKTIERWKKEGLSENWLEENPFGFDESPPPGLFGIDVDLGWTETPFDPPFPCKIIEREGAYDIIQDETGRWKKIFRDAPHKVMPQYLKSCMANRYDWEENIKPKLNPDSPTRWGKFPTKIAQLRENREEHFVHQGLIGGYMHLRNLFGPVKLLTAFFDEPELIHDVMEHWLAFNLKVFEIIQRQIELDSIGIGEDIAYKNGMLISPEMYREFLMPYYQEFIRQLRRRQKRKLYVIYDTDGNVSQVLPIIIECEMNALDPFEVAAGNDIIQLGQKYPNFVIFGGIDKRCLAKGKEAMDSELTRLFPVMLKRGGWFPQCDHCVPEDVSLKNYLYFRKKLYELDHE